MHRYATYLEDMRPDLVLGFSGQSAVRTMSFFAVPC